MSHPTSQTVLELKTTCTTKLQPRESPCDVCSLQFQGAFCSCMTQIRSHCVNLTAACAAQWWVSGPQAMITFLKMAPTDRTGPEQKANKDWPLAPMLFPHRGREMHERAHTSSNACIHQTVFAWVKTTKIKMMSSPNFSLSWVSLLCPASFSNWILSNQRGFRLPQDQNQHSHGGCRAVTKPQLLHSVRETKKKKSWMSLWVSLEKNGGAH